MGYNVPTYDTDNMSFGPGIVRIGAVGATPTTDVGAIDADQGITVEVQQSMGEVRQGNPAMKILGFAQTQGAKLSFNGIEWDYDRLAEGLGTATTSADASVETVVFGGDPTPTEYALQVEHQMAQSGHTAYFDMWAMIPEGGMSLVLNQDVHAFPNAWEAVYKTTNWAGASLAVGARLWRQRRLIA